jgi:KaiC/GvpD/RAD55 family RecA-like ATPase
MAEKGESVARTGTPGLDELIGIGGFARKSAVLVSGEPGAGKSIVAMQFIYNGARLYGESGIYVTSEQSLDKVRVIAKSLGMDLAPLEQKGLIRLMKVPISRGYEMGSEELMREVKKAEVTRVAIDSITPFEYLAADIKEFRLKVLNFIESMSINNITLLVTAEKRKTDFESVEFSPEDFLFDGLVLMGRMRKMVSFERVLSIIKMRGTKHSEDMHPVEISTSGLSVKSIGE